MILLEFFDKIVVDEFKGRFWGALLGNIGDFMVAGAMLYVTYCEILPELILLNKGRRPALFSICGIIFGLIITRIMS